MSPNDLQSRIMLINIDLRWDGGRKVVVGARMVTARVPLAVVGGTSLPAMGETCRSGHGAPLSSAPHVGVRASPASNSGSGARQRGRLSWARWPSGTFR